MSGIAPGRQGDMDMLQARLRSAQSAGERQTVEGKINYLRREGENRQISHLREQLVKAARAGDNKACENISEQIDDKQRKLKG